MKFEEASDPQDQAPLFIAAGTLSPLVRSLRLAVAVKSIADQLADHRFEA
jgi:hypothetical protein